MYSILKRRSVKQNKNMSNLFFVCLLKCQLSWWWHIFLSTITENKNRLLNAQAMLSCVYNVPEDWAESAAPFTAPIHMTAQLLQTGLNGLFMGSSCDCMTYGSSALLWVAFFFLANYIRNTAPSRSDGKMATLTPWVCDATGSQRLCCRI